VADVISCSTEASRRLVNTLSGYEERLYGEQVLEAEGEVAGGCFEHGGEVVTGLGKASRG